MKAKNQSAFGSHPVLAWAMLALPVLFVLTACGGQAPTPNTVSATIAVPAQPTAAPTSPPPTRTPVPPTQSVVTQSAPSPVSVPATSPTPNCGSPARLTPAMTEGPYFKSNSPERTSLTAPGIPGVKLVLTGYVLGADCKPIVHALLDFWQADGQGQYDNAGYTLRGHQFTDDAGRYYLETVIPGLYPGRTEHIHVKVQSPNGPVLTTQLFFPGVARNQSDSIFDPKLLITIQDTQAGKAGTFDFVVSQ